MAQYTDQELTRLQLGYIIREGGGSNSSDSSESTKREYRQRHRQQTDQMLGDLGFD